MIWKIWINLNRKMSKYKSTLAGYRKLGKTLPGRVLHQSVPQLIFLRLKKHKIFKIQRIWEFEAHHGRINGWTVMVLTEWEVDLKLGCPDQHSMREEMVVHSCGATVVLAEREGQQRWWSCWVVHGTGYTEKVESLKNERWGMRVSEERGVVFEIK